MRKWIALLLAALFLLPLAAAAEASDPVSFEIAPVIGTKTGDQWLKDASARAEFSALLWQSYTSSLQDPDDPPVDADPTEAASYIGRSDSRLILMIPAADGRALYLRYNTGSKTADYVIMPVQDLDRHESEFIASCPQAWKNKTEAVRKAAAEKSDDKPAEPPSAVGVWKSGRIATLTINQNGTGKMEFVTGVSFSFNWTQEGDVLTITQKGATPVSGIVKEHSLSLTLISSTMDFTR